MLISHSIGPIDFSPNPLSSKPDSLSINYDPYPRSTRPLNHPRANSPKLRPPNQLNLKIPHFHRLIRLKMESSEHQAHELPMQRNSQQNNTQEGGLRAKRGIRKLMMIVNQGGGRSTYAVEDQVSVIGWLIREEGIALRKLWEMLMAETTQDIGNEWKERLKLFIPWGSGTRRGTYELR